MASSSTRSDKSDKQSIHVLDFLYPPGETSENILSSITNELIRHFGNTVYVNENLKSSHKEPLETTTKPQNEEGKQRVGSKANKNNLITHHKLFDLSDYQEKVVDIAVNKKYLCILFDDGSVHRASCHVPSNLKDESQSERTTQSEKSGRIEPLQVASDESFARALYHSINSMGGLSSTLSGRSSYGIGSQVPRPNVLINNIPGYTAGIFSHADFGDREVNLPIQRVLSRNYSRYVPYSPNLSQGRQRRIHWSHLVNVPSPGSIIYPPNSEELSQDNLEIPDESQMDLMNNFTIVSVENDVPSQFQISGLQTTSSLPELNFSQPNTGITTPTVEQDVSPGRPERQTSDAGFIQSPLLSHSQPMKSNDTSKQDRDLAGPSSASNSSPKRNILKQEGSANMADTSQCFVGSLKREPLWSSALGNLQECGLMGQQQFMKMTAMESCFLLIDEEGHLWIWYNNASQPYKALFPWNDTETIIAIGCNMFRATALLESNKFVTFYDKSFKEYNDNEDPELIAKLSHGPTKFGEFLEEEILDIQCTNFYTSIQTAKGKVFWWGLAPSTERNSTKSSNQSKFGENSEIKIGDLVTPKLEKNEMGCLVFNNVLHKFGIVDQHVLEESSASSQATFDKIVVACIDRDTFNIATNDMITQVWDSKDVVFLQEQNISSGFVVSFDGQYAIVKMKNTDQGSDLKVYLKTSLEKVTTNTEGNTKQTRYKKFLMESPMQVFSNPDFIVVAITANEVGLTFLVNRVKDGKAFLIHPSSLINDHNKWFTCGKNDINNNDNIKSECTVTTEYEATPAEESCLTVKQYKSANVLSKDNTLLDDISNKNIFDTSGVTDDALLKSRTLRELESALNQPEKSHASFSRSFSMPTGGKSDMNLKRKWRNTVNIGLSDSSSNIIQKPKLFSFGLSQNYTCLLFDNINCLYPIQFDCSLYNPPLLEILPMKSFVLLDRGLLKDKRLITLLAVPKKSPILSALSVGDKQTVQKAVFKMEIALEDKDNIDERKSFKQSKFVDESSGKIRQNKVDVLQYLNERCNGNQNVMHVAASNILKTDVKIPLLGSIMDVRNNEENMMLQTFLNSPVIWPKIRELLCERDSHGCTPFLTAVMMHNLRGADLILEAVKRDGKNEAKHLTPVDKTLFRKAICQPAFSGLTPIHALIHCSSKKQSSQCWYSTIKISNLPPSYSPRLLLKLFKSRYPSAYRAIMPVPESQWPQRTVRKKLAGGIMTNQGSDDALASSSKQKAKQPQPQPPPFHQRTPSAVHRYVAQGSVYRHMSSRAGSSYSHRADLLRANAKEGLVMFGNINEMYQALSEMNNHSLLTKADHPSGALLSVVQHLLQVELYQEKTKYGASQSSQPGVGGNSSSAAMNSGMSSSASSRISSANFIANPLLTIDLPYDVSSPGHRSASSQGMSSSSTTDIPPMMREQTINKCFDDIMVHLLMTSLVAADPNILSLVNGEGDTALAYFLTTYPRFSPSHLHKLFLNWRPCNNTNCKYNRHLGPISITSQRDIDPQAKPNTEDMFGNSNTNNKASGSSSQASTSSSQFSKQGPNEPGDKKSTSSASQKRKVSDNPILTRRGLQNRTGSLRLNVKEKGGAHNTEFASSPVTPSIRLIANLKFGPIEVNSCSGLTPQVMQPQTAAENLHGMQHHHQQQGSSSRKSAAENLSPFFPIPDGQPQVIITPHPIAAAEESQCRCHFNKARLLWNTTFQASVFYLAKNWPCVVSSIMCSEWRGASSQLKFVDCNKLDVFVENLLSNPYSVLIEVFVKTLMNRFLESKISENAKLLPSLHRMNPIDQTSFSGKTFNSLLPWLTVHRFVRSLVRQLSVGLSKNTLPDGNLKLKIGRRANKNNTKKEIKMRECLNLCLRAFSWISVIEILKAANTMLKPIRLGTVKAQPKGIIRDIHNIVPSSSGRAHLPTGVRMFIPPGSSNTASRQNIRYASRRLAHDTTQVPGNATSMLTVENNSSTDTTSLPSSKTTNTTSQQHQQILSTPSDRPSSSRGGIASSSSASFGDSAHVDAYNSDSDHETINIDDPFIFTATDGNGNETNNFNERNNDTDINEIDWTQTQGIPADSSLAWALDGHIRMRNEVSNRLFTQTGLWQIHQQNQLHQQIMNTPSVHAGYLYLSRMFCRLVKEATDIAKSICQPQAEEVIPGLFGMKPIVFSDSVEKALQREANEQLASTWCWMKEILDTLEEQLNMGDGFDTKHFVLRLKKTAPEGDIASLGRPSMTHIYGSTPDEYMMYLLKQEMGEDENTLPVLDLFSYTHLTYVLDAYLYLNKSYAFDSTKTGINSSSNTNQDEINHGIHKDEINFFKPCIDLLSHVIAASGGGGGGQASDTVQTFLQHTEEKRAVANQIFVWLDENALKKQKLKKENETLSICEGKWERVIDAFSTLFLSEGPGYERESFLSIKAGASGRIARFQRTLTSIRGSDATRRTYNPMQDNPALLINIHRTNLLNDCITFFTEHTDNHPFGSLRVRFEGEEGTGPGVNRGLFAAFTNALKSGEKYKHWPTEFFAECGNLPAQKGIFSPKVGKYFLHDSDFIFDHPMSQEKRYMAFVAIGRFLGLTLWFNQTIPLILSRPILLYLLGKEEEITFDDFAFYDSAVYKSFSRLLADALSDEYSNEEFLDVYDLCFEVSVDGHVESLIPGGKNIRVTKQSAFQFVRLCTQYKMIGCRNNELQGLKDGLHQMIPKDLLDSLEAEDFQLLLSGGVEEISYNRLKAIISFSNSRGCSRQLLERYKGWFWRIIQKMSSLERQKLLYFATGSSVLPALDNRVGNNEELSITVDIINNANSSALPMSSTCGQRISMPLYQSKSVLKTKLLQAIECQTYGLG